MQQWAGAKSRLRVVSEAGYKPNWPLGLGGEALARIPGGIIRPLRTASQPLSKELRRRTLVVASVLLAAFALVSLQLVRLAILGQGTEKMAAAEPVTRSFSRPDILDRNGRILATDVVVPSVYADPLFVQDADEATERLHDLFPEFDPRELRKNLADRGKRFVWIKRAVSPSLAQQVHELGLPGILFRNELRRLYPSGPLAAHTLGQTDIDNRGLGGLERSIDDKGMSELVHGGDRRQSAPMRLSLDVGVLYALRDELVGAMRDYEAAGAAGLVLDASSGAIIATASLPDFDPNQRGDRELSARLDKLTGGTYELGSVFKMLTIAMALDEGFATPDKVYDTRTPLQVGRYTIKDLHPQPQPLSVTDIFLP